MKQNNKFINNYEKSISLMVLSCINELKIKVGTKKLVAILQGSESNYIFENEFNNNPFYGLLQNYNTKQISNIINRMVKMGLVKLEDLELKYYSSVYSLTSKGKIAIRTNELETPFLTHILFDTKPSRLSNDNKVLFEKLRIVRKEIATATNKPAYIVCTDKVLREVARQKPSNTNSFLSIIVDAPNSFKKSALFFFPVTAVTL